MRKRGDNLSPFAKGAVAGLLASTCFALMGLLVHLASSSIPTGEMVFARGLAGLLILAVVCGSSLRTVLRADAWMVWARSFFGAASVLLFYANLRQTSVGNASVMVNLSPIFVIGLMLLLWQKIPSRLEICAVLLAVIGAILLKVADMTAMSATVMATGCLGALLAAGAYLSLKEAASRYPSSVIVWCFSLFMMLAGLLPGIEAWRMPVGVEWFMVAGSAVMGLAGQLLFTVSFRYLPTTSAVTLSLASALLGSVFESIVKGSWPLPGVWMAYLAVLAGSWLAVVNRSSSARS
jgi:drug/metabolite transporter (DMT)-like permease